MSKKQQSKDTEVILGYCGQVRAARKFLVDSGKKTAAEVAAMTDRDVEQLIEKDYVLLKRQIPGSSFTNPETVYLISKNKFESAVACKLCR